MSPPADLLAYSAAFPDSNWISPVLMTPLDTVARCLVPANGRGHLHAGTAVPLQPTPWACRRESCALYDFGPRTREYSVRHERVAILLQTIACVLRVPRGTSRPSAHRRPNPTRSLTVSADQQAPHASSQLEVVCVPWLAVRRGYGVIPARHQPHSARRRRYGHVLGESDQCVFLNQRHRIKPLVA